MKTNATVYILLTLQILASSIAQGRDERCQGPPYGASMEAYNMFVAEAPASNKAGAAELLSRICEMKYGAGDRTDLYRAGFTPEDIDHSSTVMLTAEYLGVMKYVAFQNHLHEPPAPKPSVRNQPLGQPPSPPPGDYQSVTVRDFAASGSELAAQSAKVSVTGAYILQGKREMLYADVQAVIKTKYALQSGAQPSVPLLTNAASDQFRRRSQSCQTDPSAAEVGCTVKLRGRAVMCAAAHGDAHEVPCINVEDGK